MNAAGFQGGYARCDRRAVMFCWLLVMAVAFWSSCAWGVAPLEVFVSIPPQKYFVERVGGEHVSVSVIVEPGRSPATYEPTPRQITRLSRASLYFAIGVAFDDVWMKLILTANPELRIIALQKGISLREVDRVGNAGEGKGV